MNKIYLLAVVFLCVGCSQARLAISGIDTPELINNYQPVTPILVGKATATMVASIKKSNQIADDTAQAIIKELCTMEPDYREYWIKRQLRVNKIDYNHACDIM